MSYQKDFMTVARELAAQLNITKGAAIKKLAKENPELHQQYLASIQPVARRKNKNDE